MKNVVFILMLSFFLISLSSCEKEEFTNDESVANSTQTTAKGGEIYARHINNGVECNCTNNILVFPSWEVFWNTVESLEIENEQRITNFSNNSPKDLTDMEFEAYSDSLGFNEEQVYLNFEAAHQFASLREMLYDQETAWLESLGEFEVWNAEEDPDNHYVWYEKRVLLNEQAEVIVKDSLGNEVIYKFYEGGHVKITNNDYDVLVALNTTSGPITSENLYYGPNSPNDIFEYAPEEWPYFPNDPPSPPSDPGCKTSNDIRRYFSTGSDTRIKTVDKFSPANNNNAPTGGAKIKSKTKYYRHHWYGWTRGKTTITARLEFDKGIVCGNGDILPPKYETRKASKVKVKYHHDEIISGFTYVDPQIVQDAAYGIHKRRQDVTKKIDLYNGVVQP